MQEGNTSEEQIKSSQMIRVKRAKSNKASHAIQEKCQVKEVDTQEPVMIDQDMLDVDMLVWSSNSSQVSSDTQEKLMLIQHFLDVNMLVWSSNSSQVSQDTKKSHAHACRHV